MSSYLRPLLFVSIASASLLLVHCGGGDDILQNPEPDAAADGSVDGRAPNDATVPKDATSDTTSDTTVDSTVDASDAGASDATTPDATLEDASDAASKDADASDAGSGDGASGDGASGDGASGDGASGDDASDGDVADAPVDTGCGPVRVLNPIEAGTGPSCPFATDGGGIVTCGLGESCCEPGAGGTSFCAATCPGVDGGTVWECQDPGSCPTGDVCCAITTGAGQDPGCTHHFLNRFKGTTCRTQCQAGEILVCETQSECASVSSTTCQVTIGKGLSFGLCLP